MTLPSILRLRLQTSNISYHPDKIEASAIKEKIEKLGYHVVTEKAEFQIEGMTCAACANRIEKRLNKIGELTAHR